MPLKLQDIVCWEALAGANLELVLELFVTRRARSLLLGYQGLQRWYGWGL